jgi:hypothetical protein
MTKMLSADIPACCYIESHVTGVFIEYAASASGAEEAGPFGSQVVKDGVKWF